MQIPYYLMLYAKCSPAMRLLYGSELVTGTETDLRLRARATSREVVINLTSNKYLTRRNEMRLIGGLILSEILVLAGFGFQLFRVSAAAVNLYSYPR